MTEELRSNPEEGQDVPPAERERQQLKVYLRGEVKGLLDTIDDRLSAIERRLGIMRPVSAAMPSLEVRIAQVRRDKEAAIDVQDFEQAVALRDAEKQLIEERARVEQEAAAGAGAASEGGAGAAAEGVGEPGELGRLRARVADLESRLREHGIDPDESGSGSGRGGSRRYWVMLRRARCALGPRPPSASHPFGVSLAAALPMLAHALAQGGFMIMARNGPYLAASGHDHALRPKCLNFKSGHNGYNGPYFGVGGSRASPGGIRAGWVRVAVWGPLGAPENVIPPS